MNRSDSQSLDGWEYEGQKAFIRSPGERDYLTSSILFSIL